MRRGNPIENSPATFEASKGSQIKRIVVVAEYLVYKLYINEILDDDCYYKVKRF